MKIKKGDIVLCIENVIFRSAFSSTDNIYFKKDESYTIVDINNDCGYYSVCLIDIFLGLGVQFYLEDKIQDYKKFSDYFITLAEWRDKQINFILND